MKITIGKTRKPTKLSKFTKALFGEAESLGFRHLGWLKVSMSVPISVAGFADAEGGTTLTLAGTAKGLFESQAVDFCSHLDANRKLTTTTFELVVPQEDRGIYKYSHPGVGLTRLLQKHKQYMRKLKAKPVVFVHSLDDLKNSIRDYLAYEHQKAVSSEKSCEPALSPKAAEFIAAASSEFDSKQATLQRKWRFDSFSQWGFDPISGMLRLEFSDGSEFQSEGQILGSYRASDESWEWAWNNPHVMSSMARDARVAKQVGKKLGLSYLTSGIVPVPTEDFISYLCALAVKATDSVGVFRGKAGVADVMIALKNPRWAKVKGRPPKQN